MKKMPILCFTIFLLITGSAAQQVIPLYKDSIPNSKPSVNQENRDSSPRNGVVTIGKISIPALTIFLPPKEKATGSAVVICPGGGYWVEAENIEGTEVAAKFTEMGIAAFVLKYRIPSNETMMNREIGALQDGQQAIKIVRERALDWNILPDRIGIMGFSAGGHLASSVATHFNNVLIPNKENTSVRPNFQILIYPVISFTDSIGHVGSRDQILGKNPSNEKIIEYSNEYQVTKDTPPAFLVHASDDYGVKPANSIEYFQALWRFKIPAEIHIYEKSGHGFGLHLKNTAEQWMERCINWMNINGWLSKSGR
ncbi:MAG: alpha/beta hydrolase [Chitinophagaceae bacterium]